MKQINSATLLLFGGISVVSLTGCDQIEQATNNAVENAKQSAVQVVDEVRQAGSIDQAKQSAKQALTEARQTAAGLLGQASEYLADDHQEQDAGTPPEKDGPAEL